MVHNGNAAQRRLFRHILLTVIDSGLSRRRLVFQPIQADHLFGSFSFEVKETQERGQSSCRPQHIDQHNRIALQTINHCPLMMIVLTIISPSSLALADQLNQITELQFLYCV
jgi:hypothetical protein